MHSRFLVYIKEHTAATRQLGKVSWPQRTACRKCLGVMEFEDDFAPQLGNLLCQRLEWRIEHCHARLNIVVCGAAVNERIDNAIESLEPQEGRGGERCTAILR